MQTRDLARNLAQTLVKIGTQFGKETLGFITDMNQPLGTAIGNWLEVMESVECLRNARGAGDGSSDLMTVTHLLAGAMIALGKKAATIDEGIEKSKEAVRTGKAYKKFLDLVKAHGGDISTVEHFEKRGPGAAFTAEIRAQQSGYIGEIDSLELGLASIILGAGREKIDDVIEPQAGIRLNHKVGSKVVAGDSLAVVYSDRESVLDSACTRIDDAFHFSSAKPATRPLILDIVDKDGIREWKS